MTSNHARRWYVIETHAHAEDRAAINLRRQGFDIYLPRYRKRRSHARRIEMVAAPVFPRYIFVAIDVAAQQWRVIQSTFGVKNLVSNGGVPASIQDEIIDSLKGREDGQGLIDLETRPRFAHGDEVRILEGAFGACLGLFEGLADNDRVAVLLDILGRKVRLVFDAASVAAA